MALADRGHGEPSFTPGAFASLATRKGAFPALVAACGGAVRYGLSAGRRALCRTRTPGYWLVERSTMSATAGAQCARASVGLCRNLADARCAVCRGDSGGLSGSGHEHAGSAMAGGQIRFPAAVGRLGRAGRPVIGAAAL